MWKCPKCGRSFSRERQGHYCGKIETVDQYIEEQDETVRAYLNEVRRIPSHGRGIWPRDVLKEVSRGLSRVEAGNPGFPRLVQVTSGGFSWWL